MSNVQDKNIDDVLQWTWWIFITQFITLLYYLTVSTTFTYTCISTFLFFGVVSPFCGHVMEHNYYSLAIFSGIQWFAAIIHFVTVFSILILTFSNYTLCQQCTFIRDTCTVKTDTMSVLITSDDCNFDGIYLTIMTVLMIANVFVSCSGANAARKSIIQLTTVRRTNDIPLLNMSKIDTETIGEGFLRRFEESGYGIITNELIV